MELHEVTADYANFTPDEYQAMIWSIAHEGIKVPIKIWHGKIVDGRHRYSVGLHIGMDESKMPFEDIGDVSEEEMRRLVALWNERRRSNTKALTNEQKRHRVANVLEAHPDWTDRRVAEEVGVSPTSVGQWRLDMQPTVQPEQDAPKPPRPRETLRIDKRGHKHKVARKATKTASGKRKAKRATRVATTSEKSLSVDLWANATDAERARFLDGSGIYRCIAEDYPSAMEAIFDFASYEAKLALIEYINAWCAAEDEKASMDSASGNAQHQG